MARKLEEMATQGTHHFRTNQVKEFWGARTSLNLHALASISISTLRDEETRHILWEWGVDLSDPVAAFDHSTDDEWSPPELYFKTNKPCEYICVSSTTQNSGRTAEEIRKSLGTSSFREKHLAVTHVVVGTEVDKLFNQVILNSKKTARS